MTERPSGGDNSSILAYMTKGTPPPRKINTHTHTHTQSEEVSGLRCSARNGHKGYRVLTPQAEGSGV